MTGYIALGVFVLWIVSLFTAFLFGLSKGKKSERQEWQEKELQREKDTARYRAGKEKILTEVFGDAEQKKADLSSGGTSRERFNRINDSLRK